MSQQRTAGPERTSSGSARLAPASAARLVDRAARGDDRAWERLVEAYLGLVWAVARSHHLGAEDAADAVELTWLRLGESVSRLSRPDRVGSWLGTTVRTECVRLRRRSQRELAVPDLPELAQALAHELGVPDDPEVLRQLTDAVVSLPPRSQALMRLLVLDPPPSYLEVAAALGMPVGSIGPTRGRCLVALREHLDQAGAETRAPVRGS